MGENPGGIKRSVWGGEIEKQSNSPHQKLDYNKLAPWNKTKYVTKIGSARNKLMIISIGLLNLHGLKNI